MKFPAFGWLLWAGALLPLGWCFCAGLLLHVPNSTILWQIVPSGIFAGTVLGLAQWSHRQQLQVQTNAIRKLQQVVQEEHPKPQHIHEEWEGGFGEWQRAWNKGAAEICDSLGDLKTAQRTLQAQRQLLETVLGSMQEGVLVLDVQRQVLFINGACRQLLDVRLSDAVGRSIWEVTRSQAFLEYVNAPVPVGSEVRRPLELTWPAVTVDVAMSPLLLPTGSGLVIVLHDITERRQQETSRRDFFNSVSHELKTPLTAIQCWAETLLDGGLEDESQNRHMVSQIAWQAEKLHGLIQNLLRLSKIETRYEQIPLTPQPLAELVRDSVAELESIATSRQVDLAIVEPLTSHTVPGDAAGLSSILDNLISNAIHYNRPRGQVRVHCFEEGAQVVLEVRDTGPGIEARHRDRIFERFYRVDAARTSGGGSGLGLAIVKQLANAFGAAVEVNSEVGVGSTFRVRFPKE